MSRSASQGPPQQVTRRCMRRRIVVRWIAVIVATVTSAFAGYGVAYAVDHLDEVVLPRTNVVLTDRPTCTPDPLPTVLISGSSTMQSWADSAEDLLR